MYNIQDARSFNTASEDENGEYGLISSIERQKKHMRIYFDGVETF